MRGGYTMLGSTNSSQSQAAMNDLSISINGSKKLTYNGKNATSIDITLASIGAAAASHTHNYLPLSGGRMSGYITFQDQSIAFLPRVSGGNAGGFHYYDNGESAQTGGIGAMYNDGKITHVYMGVNENPWNASYGLTVTAADIKFKNNKVWHAGNDGAGSGLDADTVDGLQATAFAKASHTHSYLPLSGGTLTGGLIATNPTFHSFTWDGIMYWKPASNIYMEPTANSQEWSFDFRKNGKTGCYWHVWDETKASLLAVFADTGLAKAYYDFDVNGRYRQNSVNGNIAAIQSGAPNAKMLWTW